MFVPSGIARSGNALPRSGAAFVARSHTRTDRQAVRRKDVIQFAVSVFDQGDTGGTIRIVFDPDNFRGDAVLAAFEIHFAIFLLMTAANMARCQTAMGIAAATALLHLKQATCADDPS